MPHLVVIDFNVVKNTGYFTSLLKGLSPILPGWVSLMLVLYMQLYLLADLFANVSLLFSCCLSSSPVLG